MYDAAGNLTSDGSLSSTYDAENRITSTNGGVSYTYDGDGQRVKKSNGKLYWYGSGSDPLEETDLSGVASADYIFFGGKRTARLDLPGATVHYYFANHLGSANVVTSSTGVIQDESDFYPFGGERIVTDTDPNQYKFTGKERDTESGLDYFGARYFSSGYGRFISADWSASPMPIPYADFSDPQTLNLYSYVRNNPLSHADVDGHCCSDWADWVDSKVQVARDFYAPKANDGPATAATKSFLSGVAGDVTSGGADVLRLGNGTTDAIDNVKQGDYLAAAANLSQDGGRVAGVILTVVGVAGRGGAPEAPKVDAPATNDLGRSSTTKTTPSGRTTTTVTDPAGSTTYKTTPGKSGGQSTINIRKDAAGNVKYVKQEAWTKTKDVTKPPDHVHYIKPIDKVVK